MFLDRALADPEGGGDLGMAEAIHLVKAKHALRTRRQLGNRIPQDPRFFAVHDLLLRGRRRIGDFESQVLVPVEFAGPIPFAAAAT